MSVAFLGPRGTNSEEAAILYAGPDAEMVAFSSMPALTMAVETGLASVAILPIENSIEGPVSTTLDLLIYETGLKICAEVVVPIRPVLVAPRRRDSRRCQDGAFASAGARTKPEVPRTLPAERKSGGVALDGGRGRGSRHVG